MLVKMDAANVGGGAYKIAEGTFTYPSQQTATLDLTSSPFNLPANADIKYFVCSIRVSGGLTTERVINNISPLTASDVINGYYLYGASGKYTQYGSGATYGQTGMDISGTTLTLGRIVDAEFGKDCKFLCLYN